MEPIATTPAESGKVYVRSGSRLTFCLHKMGKKKIQSSVAQLTENGSSAYPWVKRERTVVTFSATFNTCYYRDIVLTKIKGGHGNANYKGDDGELYRVSQDK
jgi:hypothetical protein